MKKIKRGIATALCGTLVLNLATPALGMQGEPTLEDAKRQESSKNISGGGNKV